jgi:nucleotide-binding universal stress UspA family protein
MLKSILVGVSGSACSREATKLAIQWAQTHDAELIGVGVFDDKLLAPAEAVPLGAGAIKVERDQIVLAAADRRLDGALQEFEQQCRVAGVAHKTFKTQGHVADRLCEHAQRADLIVVGRKRQNSTQSTAPPTDTLEAVIKRAVRPVVSVASAQNAENSMLVAYDGSLQAARALAAFVGLGWMTDLPIRLVTHERTLGDSAYHTSLAGELLESHGYRIDVSCFTSNESPAEALLKIINETQPALTVLGAYGKSWLREVLLGSVTTSLLQKSDVPLFLFH